jgi:hypothetical protein
MDYAMRHQHHTVPALDLTDTYVHAPRNYLVLKVLFHKLIKRVTVDQNYQKG